MVSFTIILLSIHVIASLIKLRLLIHQELKGIIKISGFVVIKKTWAFKSACILLTQQLSCTNQWLPFHFFISAESLVFGPRVLLWDCSLSHMGTGSWRIFSLLWDQGVHSWCITKKTHFFSQENDHTKFTLAVHSLWISPFPCFAFSEVNVMREIWLHRGPFHQPRLAFSLQNSVVLYCRNQGICTPLFTCSTQLFNSVRLFLQDSKTSRQWTLRHTCTVLLDIYWGNISLHLLVLTQECKKNITSMRKFPHYIALQKYTLCSFYLIQLMTGPFFTLFYCLAL